MPIRTRLFLVFIPVLFLTHVGIASCMYYSWRHEIQQNFERRFLDHFPEKALFSIEDCTPLLRKQLGIKSVHTYTQAVDSPLFFVSYEQANLLAYLPTEQNHSLKITMDAKKLLLKIQKVFFWTFSCTLISLLISISTLVFITRKIISPVETVRKAALAIASGEYGQKIRVQGPKEIQELSTTLSIMSECLHANISGYQDPLEQLISTENQAAAQLQKVMFPMRAEASTSDNISIKTVSVLSSNAQGLLLDVFAPCTETVEIFLVQAKNKGLCGMYDLLTNHKTQKSFPRCHALLDMQREEFHYNHNKFPSALLWSFQKKDFLVLENTISPVSRGDYIFLYTHSLLQLYSIEELQKHLQKVWKFFAEKGLNDLAKMLHKELHFYAKKRDFDEDIHTLFFQIL